MNRREFATKIQDLINRAYLADIPKSYYEGLFDEAEKLCQPITLAEFLGWEEGVEYEYRTGDILMLDNEKIFYKSDECSSGWCNYNFFGNEIEDLRQAKKVEPKKYYAKIKGWEVFGEDDEYYWNYDEDGWHFFIGSKFHTEITKSQWTELGINDSNADFEEVE